jgi:hypothetical protein
VHLSTRQALYEFNRKHYFRPDERDYIDAEYFLINREGKSSMTGRMRRHPKHGQAVEELDGLNLEVVGKSGRWVLYRQKEDKNF